MNQRFADFLREDAAVGPVHFAAIGKHPSSSGFVTIGVDSQSLVSAKTMLYDHAALGADRPFCTRPEGAKPCQFFFWERAGQFLLGCVWTSRDSVQPHPREAPLLICAHCVYLPAGLTLHRLFDMLERVRQDILSPGADLANLVAQAGANLQFGLTLPERNELAASPSVRNCLDLILKARGELGPCLDKVAPNRASGADESKDIHTVWVAPALGTTPVDVFLRWMDLIRFRIHPTIPALIVWPEDYGSVQVVLGMPSRACLTGLFADHWPENPSPSAAHLLEETEAYLESYRQGRRSPTPMERPLPHYPRSLIAIVAVGLSLIFLVTFLRFAPAPLIPYFLIKPAEWLGRERP